MPCSRTVPPGPPSCGGIFDLEGKQKRLTAVEQALADPAVWNDQKRAQELGKEKKTLDSTVGRLTAISSGLADARELFDMARGENDDATLLSVNATPR